MLEQYIMINPMTNYFGSPTEDESGGLEGTLKMSRMTEKLAPNVNQR